MTSSSIKSKIFDQNFRFYDFRIVTKIFWSIEFSKAKSIVLNLITNVFRFARFRHNIKTDFKNTFDWSEKWKQSRIFVKVVKNFVNVIKFYKKTKYFRFFNTLFVRQSLSRNDNNNFSIDDTSFKSKSKFFIKISRLQRFENQSIIDINDFSLFFDRQRIEFILIFSFSFIINSFATNFRHQINVTSTKKIIRREFINSQQRESNMTKFNINQQRMIVVIVRQIITIQSQTLESIEFFESINSQKKSKLNDNNNDDDNKWNVVELDFFDSYHDEKSFVNETNVIDNIIKNIYFRDVHFFIIRVKKMIITKKNNW